MGVNGAWSSQVIVATQVIIQGTDDGLFVYNGVPAAGNLLACLVAAAGTDQFGNSFSQGLSFFSGTTLIDWIDTSTGNVRIGPPTGAHFQFDVVDQVLNIFNSSTESVLRIDPKREAFLVYGGTPALGNLLCSVAGVAGTDAVGNHVLQGFTTYNTSNNTFTNVNNGQIVMGLIVTGAPDTTNAGFLQADPILPGVSILSSGLDPSIPTNDAAQLLVVSGVAGSSLGSGSEPYELTQDSAGSTPVNKVITGAALKRSPSTGINETWHSVASGDITLGSGWASNVIAGGAQDIEYRKDVEDNLVITGTAHTTSATPAGTIFTLLTTHRPKVLQRCTVSTRASGTSSVDVASISTGGAVSLLTALGASNIDVYFNITVPLGNIQ